MATGEFAGAREVIVVGTDGRRAALEAVRSAATVARATGAELHIVGAFREATSYQRYKARRELPVGLVLDTVGDHRAMARDAVDDAAYRIRHLDLRVWLHVIEDHPADALCSTAQRVGADAIIVGNRGISSPFRRVRAPICERVQETSPCEVMVVDTREFWHLG
jgi:nucleotide-binding universal stress UspA family protein